VALQNIDEATPTALRILQLLFRSRRLQHPEESCARVPCPACFAPHLDTVRSFVQQQKPIVLVLPAFPAKSPNPRKVLGALPDLAEQTALRFLQSLGEQLSRMYAPGARIIIASTGRVLSDLVSVPDEAVTDYRRELESLIEGLGRGTLELFSLEHALHGNHEKMRSRLIARYADPLEQVRERALQEPRVRALYHGLHRLLLEDEEVLHPERSPTKALVRSKELACRILQRTTAWSRVIEERYPEAVRLSVYPQEAHAEQLGISLVNTRDPWMTPWHGVLLEQGESITLVKRHEAERLNASLVWRNERPSHFVANRSPAQ
jgi:pyoverdine/dityrosine biosynthesis protein Dit1